MEEQAHTCGSTWEPSKDKSPPDSPWSWVRAVRDRPWPSGTEGPRGILCAERVQRGFVSSRFPEHVVGPAAPQELPFRKLHL